MAFLFLSLLYVSGGKVGRRKEGSNGMSAARLARYPFLFSVFALNRFQIDYR